MYYGKTMLVGQWDSLFLNVYIPPNDFKRKVPVCFMLLFYGEFNPIHDNYNFTFSSFCSRRMIIIALKWIWGDQALPTINSKLVRWSVIGFCPSLVLYKPSCAEACSWLVRHTKGQASWGVDARITEVEAWAAVATKDWSWLLLLGQGGCHGNCCSVGHIGEQGGPSRDSGHTLPLPPQKRPWSIRWMPGDGKCTVASRSWYSPGQTVAGQHFPNKSATIQL